MPLSTFLNGRPPTQLRGLQWLACPRPAPCCPSRTPPTPAAASPKSWAAGTAVPCRIDPLSGGEEITANRISDESTHLVPSPPAPT